MAFARNCCVVACLVAMGCSAEPSLTIYNQNFAVVRDKVPLDLKAGVNEVRFDETTAHLEPESVMLLDPAGKIDLRVLEQNYRNDPVSKELLLSLFEGKEIAFVVKEPSQPDRTVQGKIIRSGYVSHSSGAMQRYGNQYSHSQMAYAYGSASEPIIESEGRIRFGLPGLPVFPSLGDDTILKPMITWKLQVSKDVKLDAQLTYMTGGMSWFADYNAVAEENGDTLDLVGWVTMDNQSGKTFENTRIKLMAGDVSKLQPGEQVAHDRVAFSGGSDRRFDKPNVTERSFDEYHLYTLERPCTLRDRETKQVEFVRASGIAYKKIYVYDGLRVDWSRWRGYGMQNLRSNSEFGNESETKVAVLREFQNVKANGLGLPLPKGRIRFYMKDGPQMEFTGENTIDHTPKDERVRILVGNAFDLVGERRRVRFVLDSNQQWSEESVEIKVRNHKKEPVEIRVVEHLYRWSTWDITERNAEFTRLNAQEIVFPVSLKPDEEKTVTYKVRYSW